MVRFSGGFRAKGRPDEDALTVSIIRLSSNMVDTRDVAR